MQNYGQIASLPVMQMVAIQTAISMRNLSNGIILRNLTSIVRLVHGCEIVHGCELIMVFWIDCCG